MKNLPRRTVLALSDKASASALIDTVQAAGLSVDGLCWDGPDAVQLVEQIMPDILMMDFVLPRWDGLEALRRVGLLPLFTMPFVIMLTPAGLGAFEKKAYEAGACRVMSKPLSAPELTAFLDALKVTDRLPRTDLTEERVLSRLWSLGFSAKLPGTRYLAAASMLVSKDAKLMRSLTGKLYPMVAERFHVRSFNVEHAMRRAIESAWSGSAMDQQHALFGNTIDARRGKPTAGEMIGRLVELARVKEL